MPLLPGAAGIRTALLAVQEERLVVDRASGG